MRPSQIWGTKEGVGRFGPWDPPWDSGPRPNQFFLILSMFERALNVIKHVLYALHACLQRY